VTASRSPKTPGPVAAAAGSTRFRTVGEHHCRRREVADSPPTLPNAGTNGAKTTFFPPVSGYRFFLLTYPPGHGSSELRDVHMEAGLKEIQEKLPGVLETNEYDEPGHTTDTVDMEIVLSGEIVVSSASSCISKTVSSAAVLAYIPARDMRSIRRCTPSSKTASSYVEELTDPPACYSSSFAAREPTRRRADPAGGGPDCGRVAFRSRSNGGQTRWLWLSKTRHLTTS
jgi:hypothetical protein